MIKRFDLLLAILQNSCLIKKLVRLKGAIQPARFVVVHLAGQELGSLLNGCVAILVLVEDLLCEVNDGPHVP